jgi:hypothetical protein
MGVQISRGWLVAALAAIACEAATTSPLSTTTTRPTDLPAGFSQFASTVGLRIEGNYVVVSTTDVPDHTSPYFGSGSAKYESPQAGMVPNPSLISAQTYVLKIPRTPAVAGSATDTPMDAIGVALNGVVFFNQYAAGRTALGPELISMDRWNGHPAPRNNYHYHLEPVWLTTASKSALIGFLLDGFPVYGPQHPDGSVPSGLDACNGHASATAEYPAGIYHYHITATAPYISGCFKGTAGTVTN